MRSALLLFLPALAFAQLPQFEVVSVKPCGQGGPAPEGGGGRKGAGSVRTPSPADLYIGCLPVRVMFIQALGAFQAANIESDWNSHGQPLELEGAPDWIRSERYIVEAKTSAPVPHAVLYGPMLKAVLEDRFQLKTHRETRDTPIYELTVAKTGLKLERPGDLSCTEPLYGGPPHEGRPYLPINCSKLARTEPDGCVQRDRATSPARPGEKPRCGDSPGLVGPQRLVTDIYGATMDDIARTLRTDRPMVDKTGITGLFNIHIEYMPFDAPPSEDPEGAPTLANALGKLGLKLEPSHGGRNYLVIDHIDRPTAN